MVYAQETRQCLLYKLHTTPFKWLLAMWSRYAIAVTLLASQRLSLLFPEVVRLQHLCICARANKLLLALLQKCMLLAAVPAVTKCAASVASTTVFYCTAC
jgi:hypothetical protein